MVCSLLGGIRGFDKLLPVGAARFIKWHAVLIFKIKLNQNSVSLDNQDAFLKDVLRHSERAITQNRKIRMDLNIGAMKGLVAIVYLKLGQDEGSIERVFAGHKKPHSPLLEPCGVADIIDMTEGIGFTKAWGDYFYRHSGILFKAWF